MRIHSPNAWPRAATLLVSLTLVACGSDPVGPTGAADTGTNTPDAAAGDTAGDVANVDITNPGEDTVTASCVSSADCRGGEFCADGVCREVCSEDNPCEGPLPYCETASGLCVACLASADCRGGEICEDNVCVRVSVEECTLLDERCDGRTRYFCQGGTLQSEVCPEDTYCQPANAQSPSCQPQVCEPNAIGCDGDNATLCDEFGGRLESLPCDEGQTCAEGLCVERPCTAGDLFCDDTFAVVCGDDGERTETDCEDCSASEFGCNCVDGACEPRACEPDNTRCAATGVQTCRPDGSGYTAVAPCDEGQSCRAGSCVDDRCEVGTQTCVSGDAWVCDSTGTLVLDAECESDETCLDGACIPHICTPDTIVCRAGQQVTCSDDGLEETVLNCASSNRYCDVATGRCVARVCPPGSRDTCDGSNVMRCNADGSGYTLQQSCGSSGCTAGVCNDPCTGRTDQLGCDFYTAAFELNPSGCTFTCGNGSCVAGVCVGADSTTQVELIAYNPNRSTSLVQVFDSSGTVRTSANVEADSWARLTLPRLVDIAGTQRSNRYFRITSAQPVALWHENPSTELADPVTNDLTRLLPVGTFGTEYVSVGFPANTARNQNSRPAQTAIASAANAVITVETVGAGIAAGGGVSAISADTSSAITMSTNRLLSVIPSDSAGDLSGTRFTGTLPFAFFSTNGCTNVPADVPYCDTLIEQLPPLDIAAGTEFVITKSPARGTEDDVIRVTATATSGLTRLSISAAGPGSPATVVSIDPGETHEFLAQRTVLLSASQPVMVHQYLVGGEYPLPGQSCAALTRVGCAIPDRCDGGGDGDPAVSIVIPVDHWSTEHYVYIPEVFPVSSVTVATATGGEVSVDGVTSSVSVERNPGYDVRRIRPGAGVHRITTTSPSAVLVTGYGCRSSYAYSGEFR